MADATPRCPDCQSPYVVPGALHSTGEEGPAIVFRPRDVGFAPFRRTAVELRGDREASACLTCGLVWGHLARLELRDVLLQRGTTAMRAWAATVPKTGRGKTPGTHPAE